MRGLEKRLNVHLFRTENTGVALTDPGRVYLASITPALDQIAQATDALAVQPEGLVTLTTESTIAQKWLVPRLGRLKAHHPEIRLQISVSPQLMDIDKHDFDMALRYLRADPPERYDILLPSIIRAYAAPGYAPMRDDGALDLEALAAGPLIQDATFRCWAEWFEKAGLREARPLNLEHPLSALLAIQSAVAGLGALLTDPNLCGPELQSGTRRGVRAGQHRHDLGNGFAGRRKAVRAVRRWLLDEAAATG